MRQLKLIFLLFLISFTQLYSQVNPNYHTVKGYTRKDGTVVKPYKRTNRNNTNRDNYTTKPNINPHTGKRGYIEPDNKIYTYPTIYSTSTNYNKIESKKNSISIIDMVEFQKEQSEKWNDPEYIYRNKPTYQANTASFLREHSIQGSAIKAKIPKGSKVKIINSFFKDKWEVAFGNKTGWIDRRYLNFYEPSKKEEERDNDLNYSNLMFVGQGQKFNSTNELYKDKPVYLVIKNVNLREHMSYKSAILAKIPKGSKVKILNSFFRDWWEVYIDGRKGYLPKINLKYSEE